MTLPEIVAISALVTNLLVSGFTLFRACQAVKELRELRKEHKERQEKWQDPYI